MDVTDLEEYCRQRYNAVNNTRFFTSSELQRYIYHAELTLARETDCIRNVYTTTSVASQQEYAAPTRSLKVKRVSYDGVRVEARSLEEVLALTSSVASPTGTPYIYALWNETIYFGPVPSDTGSTIKIWSVDEPSEVEATSTIDVPGRYHLDLAEYVNWQMCVKDKNYEGATYHKENWKEFVKEAKAFERKMLRGDALAFVRDADCALDSWNLLR